MNEPIVVAIEGKNGEVYGSIGINSLSHSWKKYAGVIKVNQTDDHARLTVTKEKVTEDIVIKLVNHSEKAVDATIYPEGALGNLD